MSILRVAINLTGSLLSSQQQSSATPSVQASRSLRGIALPRGLQFRKQDAEGGGFGGGGGSGIATTTVGNGGLGYAAASGTGTSWCPCVSHPKCRHQAMCLIHPLGTLSFLKLLIGGASGYGSGSTFTGDSRLFASGEAGGVAGGSGNATALGIEDGANGPDQATAVGAGGGFGGGDGGGFSGFSGMKERLAARANNNNNNNNNNNKNKDKDKNDDGYVAYTAPEPEPEYAYAGGSGYGYGSAYGGG